MLKFFAFGAAVGAGIQAWRAIPPDGPINGASAAVLFAVSVLAAYLAGRWHGRGRTVSASATAVAAAAADATATNTVNLAVVVPGATRAGHSAGPVDIEGAPWFAGQRPAITADDLDGIDLADITGMTDYEAETDIA